MKLIIGKAVSILIREEDFTEITVGHEDITYSRCDGSKALIKFPQGVLVLKDNNEAAREREAKKNERIAAADLKKQKQKEIWMQEQNLRDEELRRAQAESFFFCY